MNNRTVASPFTWLAMRTVACVAAWVTIMHAGTALAAASDVFENPAVSAQLISAEDGVRPDSASISLGLVLDYAKGWKGYWRTPGEVGLAPEVKWAGSSNLASAETFWPAPERFEAFGIENFGYSGKVVLPIQAILQERGKPLDLRAQVTLLTCSDVCVPHAFELSLSLPVGTGVDQSSAKAIATFIGQVPATPIESNIEIETVAIDAKASALFVTGQSSEPFHTVDVFPEFGPLVTFGKPDIRLGRDRLSFWARVPLNAWSDAHTAPLITVTDRGRAVTAPMVISADIPAPPYNQASAETGAPQLALIAMLALLGGLILNVMPCVLPVLSIKLASALKASGQSQRFIRNGFLFSALGVLTFVWILAAVVLGLKWIGLSVGWGIQFQNPFFVALMFIVITIFAANLFGLFEITLPTVIQNSLGAGSARSSYAADFGTGFLAAILATPCSAPFLGTAIAFALAGTAVHVLIVFTALGFGLATPYFLIAAHPSLVQCLPRPGRWMLVVRIGLGILLLATAGWLLFVLVGVAGWPAAALVTACCIVLIFMFSARGSRLAFRRLLVGASLIISMIGVGIFTSQSEPDHSPKGTFWQGFEPGEIARHLAEGHSVFVDVTADWCLTCKANKSLVLERGEVAQRLTGDTIIAMQADWTRPDDDIARFLERHGRFGIPFNIAFGPNAPAGIALPELLNERAVLDALDMAASTDPFRN